MAGIVGLAGLLIANGATDEALALLARIPETPETRRLPAEARLAAQQVDVGDRRSVDVLLDGLFERVRDDDDRPPGIPRPPRDAGPEDPRTTQLPQGPVRPVVLSPSRSRLPGRWTGSVTTVQPTSLTLGDRTVDIRTGPW